MALSLVPFALQNGSHSADLFRQAVSSVIPPGGGLVTMGDFAVTQTGTPSMNVLVGVGRAWVPGTNVGNVTGGNFSKQAMYFALNDAAATVSVTTSDPTNPRIDVVYLAIQDSQYAGTTNTAVLGVAAGVPTAGATYPANAPAIPSNAIALAWINVTANAASITNANITNLGVALTKHAEWNTSAGGLASATVYNLGTANTVSAATTDPNFFTFSNGGIVPNQPGAYIVTYTVKWSSAIASGNRAFLQLTSGALGAGTQYSRNSWGAAEDTCTTTACVWIGAGGAVYPSEYQNQGTLNLTGYLTIQKVG